MTLNLRAFLEDAGLEDFESKLKEGGVERILDLKTLGDEELTALGLPQGARERMLATMETFKPEPNGGVVAPSSDDAADADDKAAMKAKLAAMRAQQWPRGRGCCSSRPRYTYICSHACSTRTLRCKY